MTTVFVHFVLLSGVALTLAGVVHSALKAREHAEAILQSEELSSHVSFETLRDYHLGKTVFWSVSMLVASLGLTTFLILSWMHEVFVHTPVVP